MNSQTCCPSHLLRVQGLSWCYACGRLEKDQGKAPLVPINWATDKCQCTRPLAVVPGLQWCPQCGSIRRTKGRVPTTRWERPGGPYAKQVVDLRSLPVRKPKDEANEG